MLGSLRSHVMSALKFAILSSTISLKAYESFSNAGMNVLVVSQDFRI